MIAIDSALSIEKKRRRRRIGKAEGEVRVVPGVQGAAQKSSSSVTTTLAAISAR
jgi:hypothetical protein